VSLSTLHGCGRPTSANSTKTRTSTTTRTTTTTTTCVETVFNGSSLNLLQWNPHWQCFKDSSCEANVHRLAVERLQAFQIDFANLIEYDMAWQPPQPWRRILHTCGVDVVMLVYDSSRWELPDSGASGSKGCIVPRGRPYIIQQFNGKYSSPVIVVGAHYDHCAPSGNLPASVSRTMQKTGVRQVILIADTNRYALGVSPASTDACQSQDSGICSQRATCRSNIDLLEELVSACNKIVIGAELQPSCCKQSHIPDSQAFLFPFDRIVTNFGVSMQTRHLDEAIPSWVTNSFHRAIAATLIVDSSELSADMLA